jgi:hypothetical protein
MDGRSTFEPQRLADVPRRRVRVLRHVLAQLLPQRREPLQNLREQAKQTHREHEA